MLDVKVDIRQLENTVQEYEKKGIEEGKIVFFGDSSFTRWQETYDDNANLEDVLRNRDGSKAVINHGIGGSTSEELLYYYPRLVRAWNPKALVIESFGNDMSAAYSSEEMVGLQSRIFEYARKDFPGIRMFVCDVRPLKKRSKELFWQNHTRQFNELLNLYCQRHEDVTLISHAKAPEFFEEGCVGDYSSPRGDLFIQDEVHYNHKGYEVYREFFWKALKDLL